MYETLPAEQQTPFGYVLPVQPARKRRVLPMALSLLVVGALVGGGTAAYTQEHDRYVREHRQLIAQQAATAAAVERQQQTADDLAGARQTLASTQEDLRSVKANREDLVSCLRSWLEVAAQGENPSYGLDIINENEPLCRKAIADYKGPASAGSSDSV